MASTDKKGFRMVENSNMAEYTKKLRIYHIKVAGIVLLVIAALIAIIVTTNLFVSMHHFTNFSVDSSIERADTEATKFASFADGILKYTNDGAILTNVSNELIWNQTYEMSNPTIAISGDYLVLYDKRGTEIYIMTADGLQGSVETTMAISQVCIAQQGTIAVLMEKNSAGYLNLYDKTGKETLVGGAIYGENGGYPISIALSQDALKLAVSMLDVNDGNVKTTVAFYNFDSVGQNVTDHCVGVNSFSDMVIPDIRFTSKDRLVAFGDSGIIVFEGSQKPQMVVEIPVEKEAQSVFCNASYIGMITSNDDEDVTHHLAVYSMGGNLVMERDFPLAYTDVEILSNNEICITNDHECSIYTIQGVEKFSYLFDVALRKIIPGNSKLNYTFILEGMTEKVQLK